MNRRITLEHGIVLMAEIDDTRHRILEAAGPLFAEHGFKAASVRTIIEQAGVNLGAVNYHFRSKEQLYIETVRHAYQVCSAAFPQPSLPAVEPADQRLFNFIHWFLRRLLLHRDPPWHVQLILREVDQPTEACAEIVREFIRPTFELLQPIVRDLLPESATEQQRNLIGGSIIAQCMHQQRARHIIPLLMGQSHLPLDVEQMTHHVHRFSLAGIRGYFCTTSRGALA